MFPVHRYPISWPVAVPPAPATATATALQPASRAAANGPDTAAFCDEVVRVLRSDEPVGGRMRAATLALVTTLEAWPAHLPIRLHTEGDKTGRRYGPVDASSGHVESLHVKHTASGHYAIAARVSVPAEAWWDLGAESDSLFEAVLVALQFREAGAHARLTDVLKAGRPAGNTDAQWLRQGLANLVERDRGTALQALEPVFAGWATADALGPIDGQLLREIVALGADCIETMVAPGWPSSTTSPIRHSRNA